MSEQTDIRITCTDGFELGATLFQPSEWKAAIMIGPATGIKRGFYKSFASFLADKGYGVLTFDNRGIGGSKRGSINEVDASLENWGRLDMTAVLEKLKQVFPATDYHLIGHSAGGQLVGLMENAEELKSMFNFACSSGSLHNSKYPFKIKSAFYLNLFIPFSNFFFGQTNSQWVGMGEPLPKLVAADWSRWCNGKGYVKVDMGNKIKRHLYDDLNFDSLWVHAIDDEIANLENVKDMIRVFPEMNSKIVTIDPKDYGFTDLGHMKFFSTKRMKLWDLAIDWLERV